MVGVGGGVTRLVGDTLGVGATGPTRMTICCVRPTRPSVSRTRAATIVSPGGNAHCPTIGTQYCIVVVGSTKPYPKPPGASERVHAEPDVARPSGLPAPSLRWHPKSFTAATTSG